MRYWLCCIAVLFSAVCSAAEDRGVRIKDITSVDGARTNQLFGVGLVVGLNRTGGRSLSTQQMAIDMLRRMDVTTKIAREGLLDNVFLSNNISAVMVTTELPPFARAGSKLDVSVSILDDGQSLKGGTLLMTTLKGADGEVYATAQGPVSIGGFNLESQVPQTALLHHPTSGRVSSGAIVEKEALGTLETNGRVRLLLEDSDAETARQITAVINGKFPQAALTLDAGTVDVTVPPKFLKNVVHFIAEIGSLEVHPDTQAKVIINERTGTVIVGQNVRVATVAITHGNLVIRPEDPRSRLARPLGPAASALLGITQDLDGAAQQPPAVAAPGAGLQGTRINVVDREEVMTVAELARALNALGTSPKDLISIFQALKRSGALHAELVLM